MCLSSRKNTQEGAKNCSLCLWYIFPLYMLCMVADLPFQMERCLDAYPLLLTVNLCACLENRHETAISLFSYLHVLEDDSKDNHRLCYMNLS